MRGGIYSVPSVELVGSSDSLELPEIAIVVSEGHAFGVTSAESLSDPCVMESLSVSETLVAKGEAEGSSHGDSADHSQVVGVEVKLTGSSEASIVAVRNASTDSGETERSGTSEHVVHVGSVEELHVEVVGVVLDGLNSLDLTEHLLVGLFVVVCVVADFRSVASHFYLLINNYNNYS